MSNGSLGKLPRTLKTTHPGKLPFLIISQALNSEAPVTSDFFICIFSQRCRGRAKAAGKSNHVLFDTEGFNVISRETLREDFISCRRSGRKRPKPELCFRQFQLKMKPYTFFFSGNFSLAGVPELFHAMATQRELTFDQGSLLQTNKLCYKICKQTNF